MPTDTNLDLKFHNLSRLLEERADQHPDRTAFSFLAPNRDQPNTLRYAELAFQARTIALYLGEKIRPGDRVMLVYPSSLDYIAAFFGCLYAGAIAVPAYPPRPHRNVPDQNMERLRSILRDAEPAVILTTETLAGRMRDLDVAEMRGVTVIATDIIPVETDLPAPLFSDEKDPVAYLQYTSGSTGDPRGVVVTHGQLLANEEMIRRIATQSEDSIVVGWLPLYHDMGLIGQILQPIYNGGHCVVSSPMSFLQKPLRWLQAIHQYRGTTSIAPNFGYQLCAERISPEEIAELDLSCWTEAFIGSEPIRVDVMRAFCDTFAPAGFRPSAFFPCYGLAEATLAVTGTRPPDADYVYLDLDLKASQKGIVERSQDTEALDPPPPGVLRLAGCGAPAAEVEVRIVDPESRLEITDGNVGEVWVRGPAVARGYWNRPEETEATFGARLADETYGPTYLRTGDMGFLREGQVFITGRLKEIIIIRGQNHFPQDIELSAESAHEALAPGANAAFAATIDGEERLVIFQEMKRHQGHQDTEAIAAAIRGAVSEDHEIEVYGVVLVGPGRIERTSSGKIKRYAHRDAFLNGTVDAVYNSVLDFKENESAVAPVPTIDRQELSRMPRPERKERVLEFLKREAARLLRIPLDLIQGGKPLPTLGLDSLKTVQWKNRIEGELGIVVPLSEIIQNADLETIADLILEQIREDGSGRITAPSSMDLADHFLHTTPINRQNRDRSDLPLSFDQQVMWLISQLEPDLSAYNVPVAVYMSGAVNLEALQQSLQDIVQRHEVLRTTFPATGGQPRVRISPSIDVNLQRVDLTGWSEIEREKEVRLIFAEEVRRPFNLSTGPLLRLVLIKESEEQHILVICVHHIICDGWSMSLFFRELNRLYEGYSIGNVPELPPLPIQYLDFAGWQREWLNDMLLESQMSYWEEKLSGAPSFVDLPLDLPRPALPTFSGRIVEIHLDRELVTKVEHLARRISGTPFMVLMAALNILLYRWSGQNDLVVGTVVANRNKIETEHLIGCFVNFLAVRSEIERGTTGIDFLEQTKETLLEAYAHQDCPFEKVVEVSRTSSRSAMNPLYNVAFLLQNYPRTPFYLKDFAARLEQLNTGSAHLDLRFIAEPVVDGIRLECDFNVDIFHLKTIQDLLKYYRTLLESLCDHPEMELEDFALLTPEEEKQYVFALTGGLKKFYANTGVHHLFEEQAAFEPARIALSYEDATFSYRETNDRANRLAHHLIEMGAGPDRPVGLFLERTPNLIISILAILKAGAGFVPLDPRYPRDRIAFTCDDADLPIMITESTLAPTLHDATDRTMTTIVLERDAEKIARQDNANPRVRVQGDALCYIIYTSGSTGVPKGCRVTHANVIRLFQATGHLFSFGPEDVWSLFHSCAFDFSVWEIWGALMHGARLVIVPHIVSRSPDQFYDLLIRRGITILNQTPAAFRQLSRVDEHSRRRRELNLRYVIFGGETLNASLLEGWMERHGDEEPRLVNMYGITETTVHVTYRRITRRDLRLGHKSFIGMPMPDLQIYLLDARGRMVPPGFPGEMYIVGDGVTAGYHERPELTAERFLPDRISGNPDQRLYRSGDIGRYLPNGDMEYLGRADKQVKVRGFRIEPGEIEAALLEYPGIKDALVVPTLEQSGDTVLTTYLVVDQHAIGGGPESEVEEERISSHNRTDLRVPFKSLCQVHTLTPEQFNSDAETALEPEDALSLGTENISCSGTVLSNVKASLPYGQGIRLQLELPPHGLEIQLKGTIVWRRGNRAGVRFRASRYERDLLYSTVSDIARGQGFARTQIRSFLNRRLPDYMIPTHYVLLNSLPQTPNGKIDLRALPEPVRVHGNRLNDSGFVAPRDPLELQLTKIWEEVLNVRPLGVTDNFFDQGGHSLLAVQLIAHIKQKFRADLPLSVLFNAGTIEHMATLLRGQVSGDSHSPLVEINPISAETEGRTPLFFVHPAGGNVLCFVHLARNLGREQPFYGLQAPGLDGDRLDFRAVEDLAGMYVQAIQRIQPQGPYLLGGYSFGGTVAFEMARQFRAAGETVERLVLLDSWAPIYTPRYDDATLVAFFALELSGSMAGLRSLPEVEDLRHMNQEQQQEFLLGVAQTAQFLPPDSDLTRVQNYFQVFKNNTRAEQLYRPENDAIPITIFRASSSLLDEVADSRFLSRVFQRQVFQDPTLGWDEITEDGIDLYFIPGNHLNILVEPQVSTLASRLKRCIDETRGRAQEPEAETVDASKVTAAEKT